MGFSLSKIEDLTLKAIFLTGDVGCIAFDDWWNAIDFDNQGHEVKRLAPVLHRRAVQLGYDGPLREQLKGLSRHIWIVNEIRLKALPRVLDLLAPCGDAALMKGVATLAHMPELADLRPSDIDLLVSIDQVRDVFERLTAAGFRATPVRIDTLSDLHLDEMHSANFQDGSFDLFDVHWRALRDIVDPRLAQEMLVRAESMQFGQQSIRVLELGDHIFQTLMHGIGLSKEGRIDSLIDVAYLASTTHSAVAWTRVKDLADRYGAASTIFTLMTYLREEVGVDIPSGNLRRLA